MAHEALNHNEEQQFDMADLMVDPDILAGEAWSEKKSKLSPEEQLRLKELKAYNLKGTIDSLRREIIVVNEEGKRSSKSAGLLYKEQLALNIKERGVLNSREAEVYADYKVRTIMGETLEPDENKNYEELRNKLAAYQDSLKSNTD